MLAKMSRLALMSCLPAILAAGAAPLSAQTAPLPIFRLDIARGAGTTDEGWWLGGDTVQYAMSDPQTMFCAFADTILAPPGPFPSRRPLDRVVPNTIAMATKQPDGVFRPTYWYRGSIDSPEPFFVDPVTLSHPALNTYYWPMRPFFHGGKLFVCLQQRSRQNANPEDDVVAGSDLARVNNPAESPHVWDIDYLKIVEHGGNPWLGTECLILGDHVVIFGYANLGSHPHPTVAVRLPLGALLDAPDGSDLRPHAEYLADDDGASTWKPGVVGPDCWNLRIPSHNGFTIRFNSSLGKWQAVYLEDEQITARSPSRHARIKLSAVGPFGPWEEPRDVPLAFPEFNPATTLYHPEARIYGVREVWELSSDPGQRINIAYTNNLIVPPGRVIHEDMRENMEFYRVKFYEVDNPHN